MGEVKVQFADCVKFPLEKSHREGLLDESDEVFGLVLLPPSSPPPPVMGLTLVLVRGSVPFFSFNSGVFPVFI